MWASPPLRVICRTLCRAGPACPAGSKSYRAAGHMGPALRIILRPFGAEHHRQADVGADDPIRPQGTAPLMSRRGYVGISPYGRFAAPLCRAGPACPAGSNAYCAAGHTGPALRIILRPLRCRASPTGGRRGGRPCPPEQREALPSRCEHWRGNPFPSPLTS